MICDMVTVHSYIADDRAGQHLVVRRFRPVIRNSVSIQTPEYATMSLTTRAMFGHLEQSIHRIRETMEAATGMPPPGG